MKTKQTYTFLLITIFALTPIIDSIIGLFAFHFTYSSIIYLIACLCSYVFLIIRPLPGSWFTILLFSVLPILPLKISISHLFYSLIALSIISFYSKRTTLPFYLIIVAANTATIIIYDTDHNVSSITMRTIIYASILALPILCGSFLRYQLKIKDQEYLLKTQENNLRLARYLHDYTSNNLCDIILLSDKMLEEKEIQNIETIRAVRQLALSSLKQIRSISKKLDSSTPESSNQTINNFTEKLSELCNNNQAVLEELGFSGTILFPNTIPSLPPNKEQLILDIIQELCGNISKHADKQSGYAIILTAHDDSIAITSVNVPRIHQSELSNGSGLQKCEERIKELHGSLTIENSARIYKVSISLPN